MTKRKSPRVRMREDREQIVSEVPDGFKGFISEPFDPITSHTPFRVGAIEIKHSKRYCTRIAKERHYRSLEVAWFPTLHRPAIELFAMTDDSITVEMLKEMQDQGLISK